MTELLKEYLRTRISVKALALVSGIWLVLQGTAVAATCSGSIAPNFPTPVNPPNPADTQAIQNVIAQYGAALESKDGVILNAILDPSVSFELCSAGGNTQEFLATDATGVLDYYKDLWPALTTQGLTTQHIFSSVILSTTGPNTIVGRFTHLVFLQASFGALNPDYSGTVKATFVRNAGKWQFEDFLLVAVIPDLGGGIGTRAR